MSKVGCNMRFHSSKRGFSLIGMLATSAIGAILVTGIMQFFANINRSVKDMKAEINQGELERYLLETIDCKNTLEDSATTAAGKIWTGANITALNKVKNSSGNTVLNVDATINPNPDIERLKSEYSIYNPNFEVTCDSALNPNTTANPLTCNCSAETISSTAPCEGRWSLKFTSQKKVDNTYIYNYPVFFSVEVKFTGGSSTTPPTPAQFSCTLKGTGKNPCLVLTDASNDQLTLAGCGGTENVRTLGMVAFGFGAGKSNTTGGSNTFIGLRAGENTTSGGINTFVGAFSGQSNVSGGANIFVGRSSGARNTTGSDNVVIGANSGFNNTTGGGNVFIGRNSGRRSRTGESNVFVGRDSGRENTTGGKNTFIGFEAGKTNSTGEGNIYIGYQAGVGQTTGDNNILLRMGDAKIFQLQAVPVGTCPTPGCSLQMIAKKDRPGNNNVLIGSFSLEKQEELMSQNSNYLYIHELIEGNKEEKWVSINHSLEAEQLYASLNSLSDKRKKKNIRELKKSLEKINKLRPVQFEWKADKGGEKSHRKKDKKSLGFIAQEVSSVIPEVVEKDRKGFFTINYPELIPLVVSAFKVFQKQVQNWINDLKKLVEAKADKTELNQVKEELTDTKKELKQTQKQLKQTKKQLSEIKEDLTDIKQQLKQRRN